MAKFPKWMRLMPILAGIVIITLSSSACGFLSCNTDPGPASIKAQKVVKTAYAQRGKKYRLGGSSPRNGFDCSGLVWWAYGQHGVKIPRITTEQARTGQAVPKKLAKAGDIMVFRINRSPRGLHTGLYMGEGAFIHSPRQGKNVCIEKLDPFWDKKLIAVRRVVRN